MNTNIILKYTILSLGISTILTILSRLIYNIKSHKTLTLIFLIIIISIILTLSIRLNNIHHKTINTLSQNNNSNNIVEEPSIIKNKCTPKSEWTDDHIIPLNKYNQCDCTNDDTCIIKPNKHNLFTGFNTPKKINIPCDDSTVINENDTNRQHKCLSCNSELTNINNPVTENFTTYDPYRPASLYKNPESLKINSQISTILDKISPHNSENDYEQQQLSNDKIETKLDDNLCIHCKKGLCLNDYCTDI